MKSGAALAKGKHYLLGQFQLNAAQQHASLHNCPSTILSVPLQSHAIIDGQWGRMVADGP
jgi:hypothetical protein